MSQSIHSENTNRLNNCRALARNTLFNFVGQAVPMVAAVLTIPILVKGLGTARFGVLTLIWMVIGYFSLFDLGLGRALTKLVAEKLGQEAEGEVPDICGTAMLLMGALGLLGAVIMGGLARWLVYDLLKIPPVLQAETLHALLLLSCSIPVVIATVGLRGIMEAYQLFGPVNAIRIPLGLFTFVAPVAVLPFSASLVSIVIVLLAGRVIACGAHAILCCRLVPILRNGLNWRRTMVRPLMGFGGWMTVTNIVGPVMVYLDRFLIGALLSMEAVAFYTTPYEVITKLLIVPAALTGVLFPAFSATLVQNRPQAATLFN